MSWHVLVVRPQREMAVALRMAARWADADGPTPRPYVPIEMATRRPLFPGYVLCDFADDQAAQVRATDFVLRIAGALFPGEIERVVAIEAHGAQQASGDLLHGEMVDLELFGVAMVGSVVEVRRGQVRVLVDVMSGCTVWVARKKVKKISKI